MENNEVAKLTDQDIIDAYMWLIYHKSSMNPVAWDAAMSNVNNQIFMRKITLPKEEEY